MYLLKDGFIQIWGVDNIFESNTVNIFRSGFLSRTALHKFQTTTTCEKLKKHNITPYCSYQEMCIKSNLGI